MKLFKAFIESLLIVVFSILLTAGLAFLAYEVSPHAMMAALALFLVSFGTLMFHGVEQ